MTPTLIYCADGNRRFAEIAMRHGYRYGATLPNTIYYPPHFTDQKFRRPDRQKYMAALALWRPALATVLDWERSEQLPEVLSWAEEAAQYASQAVIIIPKVVGSIGKLPRQIGSKPIRLGYSAYSTYSHTPEYLAAFRGWPVHCLGGSVARQMEVDREIDLQSADGNYSQRLSRSGLTYSPAIPEQHHGWPRLSRLAGFKPVDSLYISFELSCIAIPMAWSGESGPAIYDAQMAWLADQGLAPSQHQISLFGHQDVSPAELAAWLTGFE